MRPRTLGPPAEAANGHASLQAPVFSQRLLRLRARAQERILGRDQAIEDELGRIVPARQIVLQDRRRSAAAQRQCARRFRARRERGLARSLPLCARCSREDTGAEEQGAHRRLRRVAHASRHLLGLPSLLPAKPLRKRRAGVHPARCRTRLVDRIDFKVRARGFKMQYVSRRSTPPHGRFGLPGIAAVGGPNGQDPNRAGEHPSTRS